VSDDELLEAIDLAGGGRWEEAHAIVQRDEEDARANWIHAVVHKIEGDRGNSRYWYRRAGRLEWVDSDPAEELRAIRSELRSDVN